MSGAHTALLVGAFVAFAGAVWMFCYLPSQTPSSITKPEEVSDFEIVENWCVSLSKFDRGTTVTELRKFAPYVRVVSAQRAGLFRGTGDLRPYFKVSKGARLSLVAR